MINWTLLIISVTFLLTVLWILYLIRKASHKEVDDLHPLMPCKNHLIKDSKYLWIIPYYKKIPITDFPNWCQELRKLEKQGKILGMHGIEHPEPKGMFYQDGEFCQEQSPAKIKLGMEIFKRAFGHYPKHFKAPHCLSTSRNIAIVQALGMECKGIINQLLHKVYHCDDEGNQPWYLHESWVNSF